MRILTKTAPFSWWGGGRLAPSSLDHVVAADHLRFRQFSRVDIDLPHYPEFDPLPARCDVDVRGWPRERTRAAQRRWINSFSDHGLLFFEVQRV